MLSTLMKLHCIALLCRTVIPILFVIVALWPLMEIVITVFRELPNILTGLNTLYLPKEY